MIGVAVGCKSKHLGEIQDAFFISCRRVERKNRCTESDGAAETVSGILMDNS